MGEKENMTAATFVLYCDWEDIVEDFTSEEAGELFKALFRYVNHNEIAQFDGRTGLGVAFKTIRKQIDINRRKYEETVEKRRKAANKRWKKSDENMQSNANDANAFFAMHNDNVNVNVNDNDNDNVNVNVNGNGNERNDNVNDNVSPSAPDFSAVELSDDQLGSLVSFSSRKLVDEYVKKARDWQIKHHRKYKEPFKTIKGWIEEQMKKNPPGSAKENSYSVERVEQMIRNFPFEKKQGGEDSG